MFRRWFKRGAVSADSSVGTVFFDFSLESVGKLLAAAGFTFTFLSEDVVQTTVDDVTFTLTVSVENTWLLASLNFPLAVPVEHLPVEGASSEQLDSLLHPLIDATNTWNACIYLVSATIDMVEARWMVRLSGSIFVAAGFTVDQFANHLRRVAAHMKLAQEEIPGMVPPLL